MPAGARRRAMNDDVERIAEAMRQVGEHARPRSDCPSAERIWDAARLVMPRSERLAILDHTTTCPACAEAWRIAIVLDDDKTFTSLASPERWWRRPSTAGRAAAALLAAAAAIYLIVRVVGPRGGPLTTASTVPAA